MAFAAGMQRRVWDIAPADPDAEQLARSLKVSPVLAQLLINRNISSLEQARSFLSPKLTELIEPEKMPGIANAVARVKQALCNDERIAIYGDYDVDGITGVSILWHLLELMGAKVEYYIPHRIDEGYGLNPEAVTQLAENGVNLIITVDCGVTATAQAKLAGELGIDLIITDHHQMLEEFPQAVAIVHPGLESYPNPDSAGAMVAMKLAWAIVNSFKTTGKTDPKLRQFLLNATTLAAMGTVADVVEMRGENRVLTSYGLKALTESKLCGIKALINSADLNGQNIDSYHIGFRLAPMLNAAGRMGHARLAVELLTSDSPTRCAQIAEYLKQQNIQRRQYQRKIFKQVREMITEKGLNHPDRKTIVLADDSWHTGVIGIVASRVIDEFFRPTILINTGNGDIAQGSGRSVAGFDMNAAISACSDNLVSFGGHAMAAGLKIEKARIPDFAEQFEAYAQKNLSEDALVLKLDIDAECSIADLSYHAVRELGMLEPFGPGNVKPVFVTRGVHWISPPKRVGVKGDHLQIAITDGTESVRCIGFGMGKLEKKLLESEYFSVVYEPQIDTYRNNNTTQFVLSDIRFE